MPSPVKPTSSRSSVLKVDGSDEPFAAYLAMPDGPGKFPIVVVLGEIFGLNGVQRAAADRVASLGYLAVAPNLLHRRTELAWLPEDDEGRALDLELCSSLTRDEVLRDLSDTVACARAHPAGRSDGAAGVVGFSFGGTPPCWPPLGWVSRQRWRSTPVG